tara:strand:- start:1008 stop:1241 length:234 start_codon:yes stop_codon:yes gene_type:complete
MITCKIAIDYILKKEEDLLTPKQRRGLWFHLVLCKFCKRFHTQNEIMNKAIKTQDCSEKVLPETDKERIIKSMIENK